MGLQKKTECKRNKTRRNNKQGENGRFTKCYFRTEILQLTSLEPQMILAGNQSKQRGPLHIIIRILHHFYVFSIIKIYLFIFQTSRIFIPLLVFSLLRYSLLVTALLCLVTPHYVFRMLISNVQKSVIVINSIETRFSRN